MKIIKGSPTFDENAVAKITGEMINIQYGQHLYANGQYVPCDDAKKLGRTDYNTYDINNVIYEIHPTRGIVAIISDREPYNIAKLIEKQFAAMRNHIISMGRVTKPPIASKGTTQYLIIDAIPLVNNAKIVTAVDKTPLDEALTDDVSFIWYIYTSAQVSKAPINIPYFNGPNESCMLSLSSIIYDDRNIFALPHEYKAADYPMIYDYNSWQSGNIVEHPIHYSTISGLCIEIARHHHLSNEAHFKTTCSTLDVSQRTVSDQYKSSVYWLKWQNAKIKKVVPHNTLSIIDQLKSIDDVPYYDTESSDAVKFENYTCCITGIPIYEDCYVIDIYQSKNRDGKIVKHNTPIQLLISAFYVHYYNTRELLKEIKAASEPNGILGFEKLTNTKCIVYRTFCPVRLQDVVSSFNSKMFSDVYKKAILSLDRSVKLIRRDYVTGESIDKDGHKYVLKSYINKFEPIDKNTTVIMLTSWCKSYFDDDYENFRLNA